MAGQTGCPCTIIFICSDDARRQTACCCCRSPWEAENGHCLQTNHYQYPFDITDFRRLAEGDLPPAFWLFVAGVYDAPLRFEPSSEFDYSNTNFILAAYIVEVVSGMPFVEYINKRVLQPAQLDQTVYDPSFGFKGIKPGTLQGSGYTVKFAGPEQLSRRNSSGSRQSSQSNAQHAQSIQRSAKQLLSLNDKRFNAIAAGAQSELPAASSTGMDDSAQPTLLVMKSAKRALALSGEGSTAGGAGAMQSSAGDLTKWYQTILNHPEALNLSAAAVERILAPTTHIRQNVWYGQGVFVMPAEGFPYNTSFLYHPGSFWGYRSLMAVQVDRQHVSQSHIIAVLGNRAIETEPPEGSGRACVVENESKELALTVPCADIQSFLLLQMLQLGLGSLADDSLLELEDLQQIKPCHWHAY